MTTFTLRRIAIFSISTILVPCTFLSADELRSPLAFTSIASFIEGVLKAIVMLSLPIISLFIVYAGFKYVIARGNSSKIQEAHVNFTYVIIGAILILGAWVLATLIGGTVTQLMNTN